MIRRRPAVIFVTALLAGTLTAQSPPSRDASTDEIPELAGAERAEGSQLVEGALPRPFVDYSVSMEGTTKKISIFQSGLVILIDDSAGVVTRKRIAIPADAVDAYRKILTPEKLAATDKQRKTDMPTHMRETIRIWDQQGHYEERVLDPSVTVASDMGLIRFLIQDLFRVIEDDREVTNPMIDYVPRRGDLLIGEDLSTWKIDRVDESNGFIVINSMSSPVTMYVPLKDLDTRFVGHRRTRDDE